MNEQDFALWASAHILATGANGAKLRPVLDANRHTFAGLGATYEEINECSQRIIDSGEIPDYPDKHIAALIAQLKKLRGEREQRRLVQEQIESRDTKPLSLGGWPRREGCNFRLGVCCNGANYPECQNAQVRWDERMEEYGVGKKPTKRKR